MVNVIRRFSFSILRVVLRQVECKSNEESRLKSFRVRVKDTQYGTAMMADMWPQNVGCRPYFRSRARPNRSDEFSRDM